MESDETHMRLMAVLDISCPISLQPPTSHRKLGSCMAKHMLPVTTVIVVHNLHNLPSDVEEELHLHTNGKPLLTHLSSVGMAVLKHVI